MRFRLRTLLILLAVIPPLLAWLWPMAMDWLHPANRAFREYKAAQAQRDAEYELMYQFQDEIEQLRPAWGAAYMKHFQAKTPAEKAVADPEFQKLDVPMQQKIARFKEQIKAAQKADYRNRKADEGLRRFAK